MKRLLLVIVITLVAATAAQAADVGVSVSIGQPGFYGSFAIGGSPASAAIYPYPVVVRPAPVVVARPVYVHVPPGQVKHGYRDYHGYPVYYRHDGRYYR
jgi:opacity protein-like surface antigen